MSNKTRGLRRSRGKRFRNWFSERGGVDFVRALPVEHQQAAYDFARDAFILGVGVGMGALDPYPNDKPERTP